MKKLSFYWNWLARVAKASNTRHNVAMKTTTTKSKTNGKTAILAVATIIAVALTTQTTVPSAQSAEMPTLPALPDPGPAPEPVFPPVPPGTFTCSEYFASVRPMLDDEDANLKKAIKRTYEAKCKPFEDYIDIKEGVIEGIRDEWKKAHDEWRRLYMSPGGYAANRIRLLFLSRQMTSLNKEIQELRRLIREANKELGKIYDWYKKMLEWAKEKHEKAVDALENLTRDCLANERDDD